MNATVISQSDAYKLMLKEYPDILSVEQDTSVRKTEPIMRF